MAATGGAGRAAEARRLHALGVAENSAGRPVQALPLLRRALDQLTTAPVLDDRLCARIWISIATSESELSGLAKGLAVVAVLTNLAFIAYVCVAACPFVMTAHLVPLPINATSGNTKATRNRAASGRAGSNCLVACVSDATVRLRQVWLRF